MSLKGSAGIKFDAMGIVGSNKQVAPTTGTRGASGCFESAAMKRSAEKDSHSGKKSKQPIRRPRKRVKGLPLLEVFSVQ
jgi:hypothetical protein